MWTLVLLRVRTKINVSFKTTKFLLQSCVKRRLTAPIGEREKKNFVNPILFSSLADSFLHRTWGGTKWKRHTFDTEINRKVNTAVDTLKTQNPGKRRDSTSNLSVCVSTLRKKKKQGMWGANEKHVRTRAHLTTVWALALRQRLATIVHRPGQAYPCACLCIYTSAFLAFALTLPVFHFLFFFSLPFPSSSSPLLPSHHSPPLLGVCVCTTSPLEKQTNVKRGRSHLAGKTNPEAHWFLAHRISKTMRDSFRCLPLLLSASGDASLDAHTQHSLAPEDAFYFILFYFFGYTTTWWWGFATTTGRHRKN